MFTAKIIAITFLSSFFGIFVVEYLEKNPTECIFASDSDVKGAKVGFTG